MKINSYVLYRFILLGLKARCTKSLDSFESLRYVMKFVAEGLMYRLLYSTVKMVLAARYMKKEKMLFV